MRTTNTKKPNLREGFVVRRGSNNKQLFSSAGSYQRPLWVRCDEATVFYSYDAAKAAAKRLWECGTFEAKVVPTHEAWDLPKGDTAEDQTHDGVESKEDEEKTVDAAEETKPEKTEENEEQSVTESTEGSLLSSPVSKFQVGNKVIHQNKEYVVANGKDKLAAGRVGLVPIVPKDQPTMEPQMVDPRTLTLVNESDTMPAKPPLDKEDDESLVNKVIPDVTRDPYKSTNIQVKDPFDDETDKEEMDRLRTYAEPFDEKLKVPAEYLKALKDRVAEFRHCADFNATGRDDVRGSFCLTVADALQTLHDDLALGTVAGLRQASIELDKFMGPIYQHVPQEVMIFIRNGGKRPGLKDLFDMKKQQLKG